MAWHAVRLGSGEPHFLWLHGWGQTGNSLVRLANLFDRDGTHILIDFPGFGQTPRLADGAGTKEYANALAGEWTKLGLDDPAILICHSFGARVAVQMAVHHPDKVRALIFIGGAGLRRKRSLGAQLRGHIIKLNGRIAHLCDRLFGTKMLPAFREKYGSPDYKAAGSLRPTFVKVVNEDLSIEAKRIVVPTLLIYGDNDTETPPSMGEAYKNLIPKADYVCLKGFGHLDILERGAYQIESHLRRFLDRL